MPIASNIYYHLSKKGSGSHLPIVLIHGAGGSHLYWPPEIRRLPDLRMYAIDLPGHGKSGGHGLQSIDAYAGSIMDWMESIGLHRAVFAGHSMGGAIALTLAQKFPEHVLGNVLVSTGAKLRVQPAILENTETRQTLPTAISAIISKSFDSNTDTRLVELAQKRMLETRPSVLHGDFIACNGFNMMASLPAIRTPTLVVCGENDQLTPLRYSQYLSDNIPAAILKVIPNAGHMVMLEQPKSVVEVLTRFLSSVPFQPGQVK
jgi:pimeloyl-ACP methyl ester carboxylesterase